MIHVYFYPLYLRATSILQIIETRQLLKRLNDTDISQRGKRDCLNKIQTREGFKKRKFIKKAE